MILYDQNFKLIGISEDTLMLLGFNSFSDFYASCKDISDLFVKDSSTFDITNNNSYLISLISRHTKNNVLIKTKNESFNATLYVKNFSLKNNVKAFYQVELLKADKGQNKKNLNLSSEKHINQEINGVWLDNIAKNMGIAKDDFYSFLNTFIMSAKLKEKELYESLLSGDKQISSNILELIKDPADILKLEPIIKLIDDLEKSDAPSIINNFKNYQETMNKLESIITKRNVI